MKKTAAICAFVALLGGCATAPPPTALELSSADYGESPTDYQSSIKGYMASTLKDPESARYEFGSQPVKAWHGRGGVRYYGYAVCASVNAKNSYGGYTGPKKSYFFLRGTDVIDAYHSGESGGVMEQIVYNMCSKL